MSSLTAFQDQIPDNHCFGCGPHNQAGLRIKSHWRDDVSAECRFLPQPHLCSGPERYLNGGITATLIDCHSVCTATAMAYRLAGRAIGQGEPLLYVTGNLEVSYRAPVPMAAEVLLVARVVETHAKKMVVECDLWSGDTLCAQARVIAVLAPPSW
jgi:acyl-coenzyme A thioesterase PaaI-like protein